MSETYAAFMSYELGWGAGRAGGELEYPNDPEYVQGWLDGTSALEGAERSKVMLKMPETGEMVEQGGPEDRATWLMCGSCGFRGPHVGFNKDGDPRCLGSCGGVTENPKVPRSN